MGHHAEVFAHRQRVTQEWLSLPRDWWRSFWQEAGGFRHKYSSICEYCLLVPHRVFPERDGEIFSDMLSFGVGFRGQRKGFVHPIFFLVNEKKSFQIKRNRRFGKLFDCETPVERLFEKVAGGTCICGPCHLLFPDFHFR